MAVYYFPGMWEWDRSIVRPLAHDALAGSMLAQSGERRGADDETAALGHRLLDQYFDWALRVDDFTPLRVETDFDVRVPDPDDPERDLVTPSGDAVHYQGRVDAIVVDGAGSHWVLDHRLVEEWTPPDQLVLEDRASSFCWAWERWYLGMRITGVIYNELRREVLPAAGTTSPVHRTRVPRSPQELVSRRRQLAFEVLDMTAAGLRIYPNPTDANCRACAFPVPCQAANATPGEVDALLRRSYRPRAPDELQEGRLGGVTWAMGRGAAPPKFGRDRASHDSERNEGT